MLLINAKYFNILENMKPNCGTFFIALVGKSKLKKISTNYNGNIMKLNIHIDVLIFNRYVDKKTEIVNLNDYG